MKTHLQFSALCICMVLFPFLAAAQCVYNAVRSGNISSASTFTVSPGTCSSTPVSGSNAVINLNGFTVVLDVNYSIGSGGSIVTGSMGRLNIDANQTLTVALGGRLIATAGFVDIDKAGRMLVQTGGRVIGGTINLGDGTGSQQFTNLEIQANTATSGVNAVAVDQLVVNKGTVVVNPNATLQTNCNLVLESASFTNNGVVVVRGNLDLSGGNNTTCGNGSFAVLGCVFATQGQINQLNCGGNTPQFCARGQSNTCPGPAKNNLNCFPITSTPAACVPLPVELTEFTAAPNSRQQVEVRWATASEKNSATFAVERSADGKVFWEVRKVAAAGTTTSPTRYELVDEQPLPGTSYYRLRQIDFDGTTAFSPVRSVKMSSTGTTLQVYPGTSAQQWVVNSTLPAETMADAGAAVQVLDMLGRLQKVSCMPNDTQTGRWTLDLQMVPAGVYMVRLVTAAGTFSQRIAK